MVNWHTLKILRRMKALFFLASSKGAQCKEVYAANVAFDPYGQPAYVKTTQTIIWTG